MQNSYQSNANFLTQDNITSALLNTITDPILVFDADWALIQFNSPAAQLFQLESTSLGETLENAIHSETLTAFVKLGQSLPEWSPERTSDEGNISTYAPRIEPIPSIDEPRMGNLLILRDISQLKKLSRNQNEFVRIVSHDLRSPLTSMQGFASMLESGMVGEMNDQQKYFTGKILSGIGQITALVDNIQDAGRFDPETGFYDMQRAPFDIGGLVKRIVQTHLVPAEKQELEISINVADDVPAVNADSNMVERAITNLVDNAIKYTPNGGKIDVSVQRSPKGIEVAVRDSGLGISPENQKKLFQRHGRISRHEHRKIKGTGLGLFIVKSVAQQHGGNAWVESVEGQGSTFILSIPMEELSAAP